MRPLGTETSRWHIGGRGEALPNSRLQRSARPLNLALGASVSEDYRCMGYQLVPVVPKDEAWLEQLRRSVYRELFFATWGSWDEARHLRHCAECWERGGISSVEIDSVRVGMIQLFDHPDGVEIGELQIQPSYTMLLS